MHGLALYSAPTWSEEHVRVTLDPYGNVVGEQADARDMFSAVLSWLTTSIPPRLEVAEKTGRPNPGRPQIVQL